MSSMWTVWRCVLILQFTMPVLYLFTFSFSLLTRWIVEISRAQTVWVIFLRKFSWYWFFTFLVIKQQKAPVTPEFSTRWLFVMFDFRNSAIFLILLSHRSARIIIGNMLRTYELDEYAMRQQILVMMMTEDIYIYIYQFLYFALVHVFVFVLCSLLLYESMDVWTKKQ